MMENKLTFDDLHILVEEHKEWANENFPGQPPEWCIMGATEELGELCHSELKLNQGIRLEEDDVGEEATQDAVGDIIIYLMDFCQRRDIDFVSCLESASEEVLEREWDSKVSDR